MTTIHDLAQVFLNMGIGVIPLYHRSKMPMVPSWHEYNHRLPIDTEYQSWFATDWNNYAVICGWTNLVVIDFDNIEYFNIWCLYHELNSTQYVASGFKVRTRHGMHVYLRTVAPAANDKRISRSGGIDVQAQSKYVVGPGCVHPSGHVYGPIGEMVFPVVRDIESVLPLDLFPRVAAEPVEFVGTAPEFASCDTEYQYDPFQAAMFATGEDLITTIKRRVRIESLFTGVQRSSADGRYLKAWCPFHNDKRSGGTMSFWIDTARQLCGCQRCGMKPMDAINLYARMHNVSDSAAVRAMAEEIGVWR
jgi:hypothetical protein